MVYKRESTYQAGISLQDYDRKLEPLRFSSWSRLVRIQAWVSSMTVIWENMKNLLSYQKMRSWKLKTRLSVTCKKSLHRKI